MVIMENVARSLARDYVELKYRAHSGIIAYLWSAVQRHDDQEVSLIINPHICILDKDRPRELL